MKKYTEFQEKACRRMAEYMKSEDLPDFNQEEFVREMYKDAHDPHNPIKSDRGRAGKITSLEKAGLVEYDHNRMAFYLTEEGQRVADSLINPSEDQL